MISIAPVGALKLTLPPPAGLLGTSAVALIKLTIRTPACKTISGKKVRKVKLKNFGKCSIYSAKARRSNPPAPSEVARNALENPAALAGRSAGFLGRAEIKTAAMRFGVFL